MHLPVKITFIFKFIVFSDLVCRNIYVWKHGGLCVRFWERKIKVNHVTRMASRKR